MKDLLNKVKEFAKVANEKKYLKKINFSDNINMALSRDLIDFRTFLMTEEVCEMDESHKLISSFVIEEMNMSEEDILNVKRIILDSLVDQMYVLLGTIEMMDMEDIFEEAFDEVHRSNMTKTLYPVYSRSGKLLKGDHYEAPNLYPILKKKLK